MVPKHLVVVEDSPEIQLLVKAMLAKHHIHVEACFDNGADTLEALASGLACDMILMDINLKGTMDGIQLSREILLREYLPIVFMTGYDDNETFDEALELSVYGFISKPFSEQELLYPIKLAYKHFLTVQKVESKRSKRRGKRELLFLGDGYRYSRLTQTLYRGDEALKLNVKQQRALAVLIEEVNQVVPYEKLIQAIWEGQPVADSALRTLIYSLRKAFPTLPIILYSKRGYALEIQKNR